MKNAIRLSVLVITVLSMNSCSMDEAKGKTYNQSAPPANLYTTSIKSLTDQEYPDNNDIETRSKDWNEFDHREVKVERLGKNDFTLLFLPNNQKSDTIRIEHVNLLAWIPTIPAYVTDPYLKEIGIVNAEWNRHQVKLDGREFRITGRGEEKEKTVRIDLARNCLNSYAWELITYTQEGGKQHSMYHGWFDFPHQMYRDLFNEVNQGVLTFEEYKNHLEIYTDPEIKKINLDNLRDVITSTKVPFENHNNEGYPMTGARKSKYKNIVCPQRPKTIDDMLVDSTKYSTFQWPGFYDTSDPRSTKLGRIYRPEEVVVNVVKSHNSRQDTCLEFQITYSHRDDPSLKTKVVIGGIKKSDIPVLEINDYNKGFKYPMGIGNHAFYETYDKATTTDTKESSYYAFVLDSDGKWIDSHFFGIDGPLLHFDKNDPKKLHFWLLSFERHAMVGHLVFEVE